jgi:hypothetical protein
MMTLRFFIVRYGGTSGLRWTNCKKVGWKVMAWGTYIVQES